MTDGHIGLQGDIEVDPRVVKEQARQTVRQLIDAVVELVTNSDDSYRRMNAESGDIIIKVSRLKGGRWDLLEVEDWAQGMNMNSLIDSLKYGAKSSGFTQGLPVRGLWGRGMKETIISFGKGKVRTKSNGHLSAVKVWWDPEKDKARWEVIVDERTDLENGTLVSVIPEEGIGSGRCSEFEGLYEQLCNHYALRGIVQKRNVILDMKSKGGRKKQNTRKQKKLVYKQPEGVLVLDTSLEKTTFGSVKIKMWESKNALTFNRWDPFSVAGIIIKTKEVPLDNILFGLDEEIGRYFFGELDCPDLAELIKKDLTLLTTTRTGIDWHQVQCREFEQTIKSIIEPLFKRKRNDMTSISTPKISEVHKNRLLKILNELAEKELETSIDEEGPGPGPSMNPIDKLTIKPEKGFAEPGIARKYSVYVPINTATLESVIDLDAFEINGAIQLGYHKIELTKHPMAADLLWGQFSVSGSTVGDNAWLRCRLNEHEATAFFEVKLPENRLIGKKKKRSGTGGGFFKDIRPNPEPNPAQRVAYKDGAIEYFTEFPVVKQYVTAGKLGSPEGKVLFAEIMSEAVCAALARKRITDGLVPGRPDENSVATIGRFEAEVNRIKSRCLALLHRWVATYRIENVKPN